MSTLVPEFPVNIILATGATSLKNAVPERLLARVLFAYNKTLDETFYVATAFAALSVFGAIAMEWRSVKGKKIEMAGA